MEPIRIVEIEAYLKLFPAFDTTLFVDIMILLSDILTNHQIEKHNEKLEELKNSRS